MPGRRMGAQSRSRMAISARTSWVPGLTTQEMCGRDSGERYSWQWSAAKWAELRTWITAYRALTPTQQNATRLILDDGVTPPSAGDLYVVGRDTDRIYRRAGGYSGASWDAGIAVPSAGRHSATGRV